MTRLAPFTGGLVLATALAILLATPAVGAILPAGFHDSIAFEEIPEPTAVSFAPDGRVFVAEKSGKILVYSGLGDEDPETFADLRTEVYDPGDRGLLGLALDPEFGPARPYVYVLYTYDHILGEATPPPRWGLPNQEGDGCAEPKGADTCLVSGRLSRLTANENVAVAEKPLVEDWCQQFSSHSVGDIQFGSDGSLYASGGDGANFNSPDYGQWGAPPNPCGDPPEEGGALRSQDIRTPADPLGLNGSVIRVDRDTGQGLPGNPLFASANANARRIIGYGFRNPFRMAISPEGDDLYVANVGWARYEEIDRLATGSGQLYNSGWPCFEGVGPEPVYAGLGLPLCESLDEGPGGASPPLFTYSHDTPVIPEDRCDQDAGAALTGIRFYEGGSYPAAYDGALVFADSIRGCIYVMFPGDDGRPDPLTTTTFVSGAGLYPGVDIEVGPGGDLFYVKLYGDEEQGSIHRISYDPNSPVARLNADPRWGAEDPLEVHLDASESTDPQGELLEFEWDLDDNGSFETAGGPQITEEFSGDENQEIAVRVTDETDASSVARITIYPGDTPPQPQILAPISSLKWRVGEEIDFDGSAADDQDGDLSGSSLYWTTRLLHCPAACHAHPLRVFPAVGSGSFLAPDHEFPAHIEIILTATDSRGLAATDSVTIDPSEVDLGIASDPPGVELTAGPVSGATPFPVHVIEGSSVFLSAPETATLSGQEYEWTGWSDGGGRTHTVVADHPGTYTALYEPAGRRRDENKPSERLVPAAVAPETLLGKRPAKRTGRSTARFTFSSDPSGASFECRIDRGPFRPCRSPRTYAHLRPAGTDSAFSRSICAARPIPPPPYSGGGS